MFTTRHGRPFSDRNVLRAFHDILDNLALPRKRSHDLRHTFATLMLSWGGQCQNCDTRTIAHVPPETQRSASDEMDRLLSDASP